MKKDSKLHKLTNYIWIVIGLFLFSLLGHWVFAWLSYIETQKHNNAPIVMREYAFQTARDTLENWQAEFLQLIWQVGGLILFLHIIAPQSQEHENRREEKLDAILKSLNPDEAKRIIAELEKKYPKNK